MLFGITFVVVCFNSHLRVPALGARCRSRKNTLLDRPPHGFMCALLLRCFLVSGSPSVSVDIFLFKVVLSLCIVFAFAALRLQSVFLSGILVEFGLQQYLLASGAGFQEITEIHLIIFHLGQGIGIRGSVAGQ